MSRCLDPQTPPEKAFRGSKHLLTRYLGNFGRQLYVHARIAYLWACVENFGFSGQCSLFRTWNFCKILVSFLFETLEIWETLEICWGVEGWLSSAQQKIPMCFLLFGGGGGLRLRLSSPTKNRLRHFSWPSTGESPSSPQVEWRHDFFVFFWYASWYGVFLGVDFFFVERTWLVSWFGGVGNQRLA